MEGDEITKLEGIEVPAGFAGDEIGHEIPEDAPPQRAARAPTLLPPCSAAACALLRCRVVARASRRLSSEKKLSARVQHFEFIISTFYASNFNNSSVQFQHFYCQMLNRFKKILN